LPARTAHKTVLAELRRDEEQFRRESVDAGKLDEAGYMVEGKHVEKV
jgi:hypothetical protein